MRSRLQSLLPAALATLAASALVAGAVVWVVSGADPNEFRDPATGALDVGTIAAYWAGYSLFALPVGFVVGMLALLVGRSLSREGRRRQPGSTVEP